MNRPKRLQLIFLFFLYSLSIASFANYQTGDVIVHENTVHKRYDHCALIVEIKGILFVLEADIPKVKMSSLEDFLKSHKYKDQDLTLARPKDLDPLDQDDYHILSLKIFDYFKTHMLDHDYNSELTLDAASDSGQKKYYCSQLVADLINHFIFKDNNIPSHKMLFLHPFFQKQKKLGYKFPVGKQGYAPSDFLNTSRFELLEFGEFFDII